MSFLKELGFGKRDRGVQPAAQGIGQGLEYISNLYDENREKQMNQELLKRFSEGQGVSFEDIPAFSKKYGVEPQKVMIASAAMGKMARSQQMYKYLSEFQSFMGNKKKSMTGPNQSETDYIKALQEFQQKTNMPMDMFGDMIEIVKKATADGHKIIQVDPTKDLTKVSASGEVETVKKGVKPTDEGRVNVYIPAKGGKPARDLGMLTVGSNIYNNALAEGGKVGKPPKTKDDSPFDKETKLRGEFKSLSSDFIKVRDSYNRVEASAKEPSAAGDLALIFNYMKILDPGSVVRESEFANAAATGSLGERFIAVGKKLAAGERLSPVMRKDFLNRARKLYKEQEKTHKKLSREYGKLSERYGVSPENVVTDFTIDDTLSGEPTNQLEVGGVYEDANGQRKVYVGGDPKLLSSWK